MTRKQSKQKIGDCALVLFLQDWTRVRINSKINYVFIIIVMKFRLDNTQGENLKAVVYFLDGFAVLKMEVLSYRDPKRGSTVHISVYYKNLKITFLLITSNELHIFQFCLLHDNTLLFLCGNFYILFEISPRGIGVPQQFLWLMNALSRFNNSY